MKTFYQIIKASAAAGVFFQGYMLSQANPENLFLYALTSGLFLASLLFSYQEKV